MDLSDQEENDILSKHPDLKQDPERKKKDKKKDKKHKKDKRHSKDEEEIDYANLTEEQINAKIALLQGNTEKELDQIDSTQIKQQGKLNTKHSNLYNLVPSTIEKPSSQSQLFTPVVEDVRAKMNKEQVQMYDNIQQQFA